MSRHKIAPPSGWVVLSRDGWYYPASIVIESPRAYALICHSNGRGPYRFQRNFLASDCASRYQKRGLRRAELRPLADSTGYQVCTEAPG